MTNYLLAARPDFTRFQIFYGGFSKILTYKSSTDYYEQNRKRPVRCSRSEAMRVYYTM